MKIILILTKSLNNLKVRSILKKLKKLYYPEKREVIKLYDSFLINRGFSRNQPSSFYSINSECFQEYLYLLAREMSINSMDDYSNVKHFIRKMTSDLSRPKKVKSRFNIFMEVKKYSDYLIENRNQWHEDFDRIFYKINSVFIELYEEYHQKGELSYLSHGDLHNKNILIDSENEIHIIDYDEVCYAPKNFDLIIFIFRFYKGRTKKINSETLKIILDELEKENLEIKYLKLYIIKVILQKKFLEYSGRLSPDDILVDNWKGWYEDFLTLVLHNYK